MNENKDLFVLKPILYRQGHFDFSKGLLDKEKFLFNKISKISKAWKYPVFDHKNNAIDIMNRLKGKNKSHFLHVSSVAKKLIWKYYAFRFALLLKSSVIEFECDLEKFSFFDFDSSQFRVSALAFSYIFNSFTKSYYVILDFGLKHFLRVPLENFSESQNEKGYDFNYLFIDSFDSCKLFFEGWHFDYDYFLSFSNYKYSDKALSCFFYVNFFFRKLRSNFFNLDFLVSTQILDDYSYNVSLSHVSMPLGSAFCSDYWHSRYLNNEYFDFLFFEVFLKKLYDFSRANVFLNFFNQNVSANKMFFEKLRDSIFRKVINNSLNSFCVRLYKDDYSNFIFFESVFKNFLIMIFRKIGVVTINKFKSFNFWIQKYTQCNLFFYKCFLFIKNFYALFFFFYYLYNLYFHEDRDSLLEVARKKFAFSVKAKEFIEDMDVFLFRKRFCDKWQDNLMIRKYALVAGVNEFFSFPLLIKDWLVTNTYHKRMFFFKISLFINSISSVFFFFLKKNYLSLFCKLNNRALFDILCNARLFFNFFCFMRHLGSFDKDLNENVKDYFFKQIVTWKGKF